MILLATLLMTPLAPGCHRIAGAIRCELAPPVPVAPPPKRLAVASKPAHKRAEKHGPAKKPAAKKPSAPPTPEQVAHHVDLLVAAADCTGARTLVAASESAAAADTLFHTCIGTARRPGSAGHDPHAAATETASGAPKSAPSSR